MTTEPLIFTSKGNVPIASVRVSAVWDITDDYIKVRELWHERTTGELVKESAHIYSKHMLPAAVGEQGTFG